MTEAELRASNLNFGGELDGFIRSVQTLSPGCDIYYIGEDWHYTNRDAYGPQKLMGVAGTDVLSVRNVPNEEHRQMTTALVGANYENMFLGYAAPRYMYTLNNNGVIAEYGIYGNVCAAYGVLDPDGKSSPELYNRPQLYAVAVPHGYTGDLSFIAVPFGWQDTYTGSTNTMEGVAKMIATNSKARLGDSVHFPITGTQVKANTTPWDAESISLQAHAQVGRTPIWLQP